MAIEDSKDGIALVVILHIQIRDFCILHVLPPALHLAAGVPELGPLLGMRRLVSDRLAQIDSHWDIVYQHQY